MRLKLTYNFLGGSVPFYYRGIFSGLSNEKVGTALYSHPICLYYLPLLHRYARRLISNDAAAYKLATDVLKDQFAIDGLADSPYLRKLLKFDLHNRCICFVQFLVLDRPPIKVPLT